MDIFEQYASSDEAPANDSPTRGLVALNTALLESEKLLVTPKHRERLQMAERPKPMPFWAENQERHRKQMEESKKCSDDQRVLADAIRSGSLASLTGQTDNTQASPLEAENWVPTSELKIILTPLWGGVARMLRNPGDYPWVDQYRKQDPAYKNRYLWEATGLTREAKRRGKREADPHPDAATPDQGVQGLILAYG
jgi:hypothetical protein